MESAKNWMKEGGYQNKISFQDKLAHTVKLLKDKQDQLPDGTKGLKLLVEEDGEQRTIFTASIGLISKLAMCELGDTVTIQMKSANNKSFYVVTKGDAEVKTPDEEGTIQVGDDDVAPTDPSW